MHVFAGIPVGDHDAACAWYERLFGRPPDRVPARGDAVWRLAGEASVYVVADPERAGSALLTIAVPDLEEHRARLAQRGLASEEAETAGGPRRAVVADLDGNRITFFESPRPEA